jgi:hypothetical protein
MLGNLGPDRRTRYHLKSNEDLYNPETNAHVAYLMSKHGKDWDPWSTYKNGAYKTYYNDWATAAKNAGLPGYSGGVMNVSGDQVAKIHQGEMIIPAGVAETIRKGLRDELAGHGSAKTVNVTLKIERATEEEAVKFAGTVRRIWENDSQINALRSK